MRQWTAEQRARQVLLIRNWKPWQHSTGARTLEGKQRSSQNALKHGLNTSRMKALRARLREFGKTLERVPG